MSFRFENKINTLDVWKLSMYNIYHSIIGVYNAIFAVAIILMTVKLWDPQKQVLMTVLVICCVVYPIVQPVAIYRRASRQVGAIPKDMVYEIDDAGIHISVGKSQKSHVTWSRLRAIRKDYGMVILMIEDGKGYMLTNRTLGTQKAAFLEYLESKAEGQL